MAFTCNSEGSCSSVAVASKLWTYCLRHFVNHLELKLQGPVDWEVCALRYSSVKSFRYIGGRNWSLNVTVCSINTGMLNCSACYMAFSRWFLFSGEFGVVRPSQVSTKILFELVTRFRIIQYQYSRSMPLGYFEPTILQTWRWYDGRLIKSTVVSRPNTD